MNPVFTQLSDFGGQYGIVQYSDGSFGACNVAHYNPPGNMNPADPFDPLNKFDPNSPTQEGSKLAWATKSNNMLGRTYTTFNQAQTQLGAVLGGVKQLSENVFNFANNPFKDQLTKSDFPEGTIDLDFPDQGFVFESL